MHYNNSRSLATIHGRAGCYKIRGFISSTRNLRIEYDDLLRYNISMSQTKKHKLSRHAFPMFIGAILVVCSVVISQTSSSDDIPAMLQEKSLNEIVNRTHQEYADMRALPVASEIHSSAPVNNGWFAVVIDEVARWFGLNS